MSKNDRIKIQQLSDLFLQQRFRECSKIITKLEKKYKSYIQSPDIRVSLQEGQKLVRVDCVYEHEHEMDNVRKNDWVNVREHVLVYKSLLQFLRLSSVPYELKWSLDFNSWNFEKRIYRKQSELFGYLTTDQMLFSYRYRDIRDVFVCLLTIPEFVRTMRRETFYAILTVCHKYIVMNNYRKANVIFDDILFISTESIEKGLLARRDVGTQIAYKYQCRIIKEICILFFQQTGIFIESFPRFASAIETSHFATDELRNALVTLQQQKSLLNEGLAHLHSTCIPEKGIVDIIRDYVIAYS